MEKVCFLCGVSLSTTLAETINHQILHASATIPSTVCIICAFTIPRSGKRTLKEDVKKHMGVHKFGNPGAKYPKAHHSNHNPSNDSNNNNQTRLGHPTASLLRGFGGGRVVGKEAQQEEVQEEEEEQEEEEQEQEQ